MSPDRVRLIEQPAKAHVVEELGVIPELALFEFGIGPIELGDAVEIGVAVGSGKGRAGSLPAREIEEAFLLARRHEEVEGTGRQTLAEKDGAFIRERAELVSSTTGLLPQSHGVKKGVVAFHKAQRSR